MSKYDETRLKIENAFEKLVDDVEKKCLRGLKKTAFACSARCCEDMNADIKNVDACVKTCQRLAGQAHEMFQAELNILKDQLSRCSTACQGKVDPRHDMDLSRSNTEEKDKKMAKCIDDCASMYIEMMPKICDRLMKTYK